MADNTQYADNQTFLTKHGDMTGVTKRKGMTTSIISAFPTSHIGISKNDKTSRKGTLFGGVLTILAIMIGSGVIGIPYAAYKLGLIVGFIVLYASIVICMQSVDLLYESSKFTSCKSLSEIGFVCLGKKSVYIINLVIFTKSFGMPIIYFILTGTCLSQIADKIGGLPHFFTLRQPYIVLAALLLSYFILKKDISDLKPIALLLFLGILFFVALLGVHMIFEQSTTWNKDGHDHHSYFLPFNEKQNKIRLVYMCLTILVGVTFQTVFFPVLNNLKDNSKKAIMKTGFIGLSTAGIIYTISIFISIYAFGSNIHSDILANVGENKGWETYILGALFAIVGSLHIPLIFFVAKEALLIIVFTFFYTENEKEEENEPDDRSRLVVEDVSHISRFGGKSEMRDDDQGDNRDHSGIPTRSELNHTNLRSQLRKTTVIPNIDVSITKQVLAINHGFLRNGGLKDYDEELKAAEGTTKEPSHRNLPLWLYLTITISAYVLQVFLACLLDDVSVVFGFVGALSISMLVFILPGTFYLKSLQISGEKGTLYRKIISWVFILFGFLVMFSGLASVAFKLFEDDYHEEEDH